MRIRITFSKTGALIYVSNLDLYTIWERAARRAGLSLAYSQGFHPQPKIQLASPLPLGFSSRCEVADLRLGEEMNPGEFAALAARLQAALPVGIGVIGIEHVDPAGPALPSQVIAADYEISLKGSVDCRELHGRIKDLLASAALPRQRRGKSYDLRPLIESLDLPSDQSDAQPRLLLRLSAREGATGRPEEVLDELGIRFEDARVERTGLIFRQ
jgi:radical SAM-linked protein